ncbi:HDOD domain protein [Gemmata sp. SH-PL17]|uniref:HDOD domain-containing protein n=1 Tax=Gemmata sp. SH-PL17 TaxID=1630693 RepID=UPI0004B5F83B|nr:HDOD domain-containing protein [Gemmata sp. SH-PL17]AMV26807.1 HDOD domain protein [Gemmata sp. SH-PL17]
MALLKRFSDALRSMFTSSAPAAPSAAERAVRLEQQIRRLVDEMPPLPVTATRALALMEDPNVSLAAIADLIREDAALATGLLRVANSALFAGGAPTIRLDQAVVRLGLWTCRSMVTAIGLRGRLRGRATTGEFERRTLWHHGFVTASICAQLNRTHRLGFHGEEYSAGLLHDLGRVLIALADPESLALAGAMDFREEGDLLARERAVIGADHCALGGWFAELSNLPPELVEVIRHHHTPRPPGAGSRLVALVAAADHMANHLQCGGTTENYNPLTNPRLPFLVAGWGGERQKRLIATLPELMRDAVTTAERELSSH